MSDGQNPGVLVPLQTGRALSPMQRSLWASQLNHPDQPVQNMALLSMLDGVVDPTRLAAAFDSVVAQSDVLRTRLVDGGAQAPTPPQTRQPSSTAGAGRWLVELIPVGAQPRSEIVEVPAAEVERWAAERVTSTIDLTVCGYDSAIAVHEDGSLSWYLNLHHVITDATSSALVFDATASAYWAEAEPDSPTDAGPESGSSAGPGSDPKPDSRTDSDSGSDLLPYYRWARSLAAELDGAADGSTGRAVEYWRQRQPAARIGRLYRAIEGETVRSERLSLPIGPEVLRVAEERLSGDYRMLTDDLAWSTLLATTTALYLHGVTGADRFAIGLPVHNRSQPATRSLIGPTMEVFPVDIVIERDDTFRTLHRRVGRSILNTLRYAMPGTSPAADYEAVVNVIPRATQQWFGSVPTTTRWLPSGAIDGSHLLRVQMTAYSHDAAGQAEGAGSSPESNSESNELSTPEFALDLNHGGAEADHRARAAGHFVGLLSDLLADPDSPIGAHSLCGPDELELLDRWGQQPGFSTPTDNIVERLEASLAGNDRTVFIQPGDAGAYGASTGADRELTGSQAWSWVLAVARHLHDLGVGPGDRVGVRLNRSLEAVVAMYGVLVAGGSFVPLDPTQPAARTDRLIARAGCKAVFSSAADIAALHSPTTTPATPAADRFTPPIRHDDDEAYLLFTSGSTGEPKGVPITSAALADYIRFAEATYVPTASQPDRDEPGITAALFSPLTFDLTITSLFMPVVAGGRLVVIEADGPQGLTAIAARPEIDWCKATPSHLEILVRLLDDQHGLSTVVVGGEAFGSRLASALLRFNPDLRIFNEYGPTEAVVGCMEYEVEPKLLARQAEVPIGHPAPGVTLLVVDEHLRQVPIGSPGELCIAHPGLTSGYLLPEDSDPSSESANDLATNEVFVEIEGQRFYRSGDLVRLQDPKRLVYLGRLDSQIKVGGIRLEPIEVEDRLNAHPGIERSAVRLWSPEATTPARHCRRCGLPDNIPGVAFDQSEICDTCHAYDRVAPIAQSWFKTPEDLQAKLARARQTRGGEYDCLHLLSGGKDSTYALYQLVELGFRPYALTLDNGFISEGAKENVRRSVADLGIDHEFATTDAMNAIFRDSLDRYSNVCHGCYKTIYTLATNRAAEIGAPLIVTGLSRGQLFETRLIPQQFSAERFDPDAIDRAVIEARKIYHRVDDGPNRLLDNQIFADDDLFERIEYLDLYRYLDVELAEMLQFLEERAPWVRPSDTGRSTNCLINAAGIHTHQIEQGYHNYAVPYAWDVRLGHKTRQEAIEELDDQLDRQEVETMLAEVGYQPRPRQVLTAWIQPKSASIDSESSAQPEESKPLGTAELRSFLAKTLPAHAIPSAFVEVDELPLSTNGKLDDRALPAPKRIHRPGPALQLSVEAEAERAEMSELQLLIVELWEQILQIEPVTADDDFFALGGDSLAALEMIVALSDRTGRALGEDLAFTNSTPALLAAAIELLDDEQGAGPEPSDPVAFAARSAEADRSSGKAGEGQGPQHSAGELAVLFDQATRPDEVMYNVGRLYVVAGRVDPDRFERALRTVAARHQPLSWSYASPRRPLSSQQAVSFQAFADQVAIDQLEARCAEVHRARFDLAGGPLLRCALQPLDDGSTAIVLAIHHASGDAGGFNRLWDQINDELTGAEPVKLPVTYSQFSQWQTEQLTEADRRFWLEACHPDMAARLAIHRPDQAEPDGFVTTTASVTAAELRAGNVASAASLALGAVAATLRCFSDGPAVELGLITSTRNHEAAEDLFGYFLNTLPVQVDCGDRRTLADIARQASQAIGGALAHRSCPLARILADRQEQGLPLPNLDAFMAFDELDPVELEGARAEQRVLSNGVAVAPLTFFVELRDNRVELSLEHRGSIVGAAMADRMLATFDGLLTAAVANPDRALSEVRTGAPAGDGWLAGPPALLIGEPESDGNGDEGATLVIDSIVEHLNRGGDGEAVVCGEAQLTWGETARRAMAIQGTLTEAGVGRGDRVVLCLPRSVNLIPAILGIQLAGAAYVPIDPGYPDDRIALIAQNAGAEVGLVGSDHRSLIGHAIVVEEHTIGGRPWPLDDDSPADVAPVPIAPEDPCYLIFTSGSTGTPRGVTVSHANLAASNGARASVYDDGPERFLMLSSVAFDSSIVGLFWTLAAGGTVLLPTDAEAHDLSAIVALMRSGVSHTLMVPTLYQGLLSLVDRGRELPSGTESAGRSARQSWAARVIVAGERCPSSLVSNHFLAFPDAALTNEYGPTEATVWATAHHCRADDDPVPIGSPMPGSWLAVVDHTGAIAPAGVEGDLIIGGLGVVEGYLNDGPETARRFRTLGQDQWTSTLSRSRSAGDGRYFLTGDRAVVVDGNLRFLGRNDGQVNVGGARVEPEEIERVLLDLDGVTGAVVVAVDRRSTDQLLSELPNDVIGSALAAAAKADDPRGALLAELRGRGQPDLRLVAHLEGPDTLDLARVRGQVAAALPPLLRPTHYGLHRQLPTTPNGKLDREQAALLPTIDGGDLPSPPAPGQADNEAASQDQDRSPDDGLAADLTRLMADALGKPSFGPNDDFFDHGGHSLLAMELLLSIEDHHGRRLPASALYDAPTPRLLAARLGSDLKAKDRASTNQADRARSFLVPIQPRGSQPPIFAVHVLGVDSAFFRALSGRLGTDQPMYGLGQPTSKLDTSGPTDVADVAAAYAFEINRVAPTGPVILAAISLGGVVAYELAQQLIDQGRQVALLALFDAYGPETDGLTPSLDQRLTSAAKRAVGTPKQYWSELADRQTQNLRRKAERAALTLRERLNLRTDHQLEIRRFIEANISSQVSYEYEPYPGPMLIVKAADHPLAERHIEQQMGWSTMAAGELTIDTAPGEHLSMMEEPHVAHVASAMTRALAQNPASGSPQDLSKQTVERTLMAGLRLGRLAPALARVEQWDGLSDDARRLLADTDRVMRGLAGGTRTMVAEVTRHLDEAGFAPRPDAVPSRVAHGTASITVAGSPESNLAAVEAVMAGLDFQPIGVPPTDPDAHLDFVRRAADTTRIRLTWLDQAARPTGRTSAMRQRLDAVGAALHRADDGPPSAAPDLGVYLGTPRALIVPLLEFAGIQSEHTVADIGCGDGRVLIEAALRFGCRGRGYEIDSDLVDRARHNARAAGVADRVEIVLGNAAGMPLAGADLVFAFLPPEAVQQLLVSTLARLPAEAAFLTHEQLGATMDVPPDRQGLILGAGSGGPDGGITIANLWHGRRGRR